MLLQVLGMCKLKKHAGGEKFDYLDSLTFYGVVRMGNKVEDCLQLL